MRRLVFSVVVVGAVAAACGGGSSGSSGTSGSGGGSKPPAAPPAGAAPQDPQEFVTALNGAGLDMRVDRTQWVDSDTSVRLFPHHVGTPNAWTYGDVIVAAYSSPAHAERRLHEDQVSNQFVAGWLCGNVTVTVGQSTPPATAQQEAQVLDHLPACRRSFGTTP